MTDYPGLVGQRNLGVRDNECRHEGVGFAADTAADAADTHTDGMRKDFKSAVIISMNREAGRVTTGAGKLVKLESGDEVIIFILYIFSIGIAIKGK